ncbi:hypothetical protein CSUI_011583, partial [Cystoisospora suis]
HSHEEEEDAIVGLHPGALSSLDNMETSTAQKKKNSFLSSSATARNLPSSSAGQPEAPLGSPLLSSQGIP